MKIIATLGFVFTLFISTQSWAQTVDNKLPMFGEGKKTKEHIDLDNEFREQVLRQFGSIDSAVFVHTDQAWRNYYNASLEAAMKRFNQVWLLNPDFPDSYFGFAALLESQGQDAESKRFYRLASRKDLKGERAPICYQRIADCKEQLKDVEGTIAAYTALSKLRPSDPFPFKKIGYFQNVAGSPKEALEAYNTAIELDPKDAMTYNNRGYLHQTQKNFQAAIADYTTAFELNPTYISALVNRGLSQMELEYNAAAKLDFEQCVQLDPKAGELRRFLALAELKLGEKAAACKNLQLALELGDQEAKRLIAAHCN